MKKFLSALLTLALSASMCLAASASEPVSEAPSGRPSAAMICGEVSDWDGNGLFLKNDGADGQLNEVVVHLGDAPVVDAVTGLPLDRDSIRSGDVLYAWAGPAMTMSLPPQTTAVLAVGNVPDGMSVPQYHTVTSAPVNFQDDADSVELRTAEGVITLPKDVDVKPWMTRQLVRLNDLTPGTQILVWSNADGVAEKVVVFAYAYDAYLCVAETEGGVFGMVNGALDGPPDSDMGRFSCMKTEDGTVMAPVRAVAESAGYDVRWDRELGAVVSRNRETVLSVRPGAVTVQMPDGDADIGSACVLENGVTYLPAADLAMWLNVFYAI